MNNIFIVRHNRLDVDENVFGDMNLTHETNVVNGCEIDPRHVTLSLSGIDL